MINDVFCLSYVTGMYSIVDVKVFLSLDSDGHGAFLLKTGIA